MVALLTVMVFLAFGQVILRHFGAGLLWAETVLKHSVLWTGFLGAVLRIGSRLVAVTADPITFATPRPGYFAVHVNANDVAVMGASPRFKPWLRLASSAAAAGVTAFLMKAAWVYCVAEYDQGSALLTLGSVAVPAWVAAAGIPGGFALILTHFLFKTADAAAEVAGK